MNYEYEFAELGASPLAEIYRELYGETVANEMLYETRKTLRQRIAPYVLAAMGIFNTDATTHRADPANPFQDRQERVEMVESASERDKRGRAGGSPPKKEFESILDQILREANY